MGLAHGMVDDELTFRLFTFATFPFHSSFPYICPLTISAKRSLLSLNLLPSGGASRASLYFPLNRPIFSGLKVVSPIPHLEYSLWNSPSTLLRSMILYSGCSTIGPIRPSDFAIPDASDISSALHSDVPQ